MKVVLDLIIVAVCLYVLNRIFTPKCPDCGMKWWATSIVFPGRVCRWCTTYFGPGEMELRREIMRLKR